MFVNCHIDYRKSSIHYPNNNNISCPEPKLNIFKNGYFIETTLALLIDLKYKYGSDDETQKQV